MTDLPAITIRNETKADAQAIGNVTRAAFAAVSHSHHNEAAIVQALREHSALSLSLVAVDGDMVVGHIAFSPVSVESGEPDWYGLGPISVAPTHQRQGIGTRLVKEGLDRLASLGARGCVVLGDPAFYGRFGFASDPALTYPGVPTRYVQRLVMVAPEPRGVICYDTAFDLAG